MTQQYDPYNPMDDQREPPYGFESDRRELYRPVPGQYPDALEHRQVDELRQPGTSRPRGGGLRPEVARVSMARLFLACLGCLPTGLYAVYLAGQVEPHLRTGDVAAAELASAKAKTWSTVSIVVLAIGGMLMLLSMCAAAATY